MALWKSLALCVCVLRLALAMPTPTPRQGRGWGTNSSNQPWLILPLVIPLTTLSLILLFLLLTHFLFFLSSPRYHVPSYCLIAAWCLFNKKKQNLFISSLSLLRLHLVSSHTLERVAMPTPDKDLTPPANCIYWSDSGTRLGSYYLFRTHGCLTNALPYWKAGGQPAPRSALG